MNRKPAVAGMFYPDDEEELKGQVERFLEKAKPKKITPKGLIVPHAGYVYSGPVAAFGYKLLQRLDQKKEYKIVIIGPSHRVPFIGAALSEARGWMTPLGTVPVDVESQKKLLSENIHFLSEAHELEHSIEVQLPFLQMVLKKFKIIPISTGMINPEVLAKEILPIIDENTILIASSDLSHFHNYETAKKIDSRANEAIPAMDFEKAKQVEACGITAILTLMFVAKARKWKCALLDYRNSGDTAGTKEQVVGYGCYAFYECFD